MNIKEQTSYRATSGCSMMLFNSTHHRLHQLQPHMPCTSCPRWWPVSVNVQVPRHWTPGTWSREPAMLTTRQQDNFSFTLTKKVQIPLDLCHQRLDCKTLKNVVSGKNSETHHHHHLIRPHTKIKIRQFKWKSEEQERQGYGTLTVSRN